MEPGFPSMDLGGLTHRDGGAEDPVELEGPVETLIVRAAGSIVLTVRSTCFSTGTSMAGLAPGGGYLDVGGQLVWATPGVAASAGNTNAPARVRVVLLEACFSHPWRVHPPCQARRQICREGRDPELRGFTDPCEVAFRRAGGSLSSERLSGGPGATTVESKEA